MGRNKEPVTDPRRHHYVPQFYLHRFVNEDGKFWIWDKVADRVFQSTPNSIAVESDFYRLHEFEKHGHDPYVMEKQLASMEQQVSLITNQWIYWLRNIKPGEKISIPKVHRYIVARFMAVQFLRTADAREIITALADISISAEERANLHTTLLWNQKIVRKITQHIQKAIWIFARNLTQLPFVTSDNPVAFRTKDNRMWVKAGFIQDGTYAVYPLAPDIVMFCHERRFWGGIKKLDRCLSPADLTVSMVESENSGQVFMASRFVISPINEFTHVRDFAKTIGTDVYASCESSEI